MTDAPIHEAVPGPAPDPARAPLLLRILLGLCLAMAVFPVGFAVQYTRVWWRERAGKSIEEQRGLYRSTPWFQPYFQEFTRYLASIVPEGDGVLLTPNELREPSGKARWFLFLNYYCYPRRFYVRQPKLASGTLVDYPRWLEHHFEVLDLDEDRVESLEELMRQRAIEEEEAAAIAERDIRWELRYAVNRGFNPEKLELLHLREGEWVRVPLPTGAELLNWDRRQAAERTEAEDGEGRSSGDAGR